MSIGVYIHIPFCRQKCLYCDFPSFAKLEGLFTVYVDALCREMTRRGGDFCQEAVDTVYIGGGTPTILPLVSLEKILTALMKNFNVLPDAEISIEANPGTVGQEKLSALKNLGINRISFGIQSFHDELLKNLGRIHTAQEGIEAVKDAQQAGFSHINIDLMFGLPGQTIHQFAQDLKQGVALGVQHISAYGLTIEAGTPFARMDREKTLNLPSEEQEATMYDLVTDQLPRWGFKRYEISNYALPAQPCRHNLKYWHYEPYIGLGSAACSFVNGDRKANQQDVRRYIECVRRDISPVCFTETPDEKTAMAEFMFLGLRTVAGVNIRQFDEHFGKSVFYCYQNILESLRRQKLITIGDASISLTSQGMKFGNQVFEKFLPD